jgi:hypothetical protein
MIFCTIFTIWHDKITNMMKKYIGSNLQYIWGMLVVKVSGDIQYDVGMIERGIEVSTDIPKFIITPHCQDD